MWIFELDRFWLIPVASSALSIAAFALFAVPMTWVALRDPPALSDRRIQGARGQPAKWILPSVQRWLVNNALMTALVLLAWPLLERTGLHGGPLPALHVLALQFILCVYLDDALYYVLHRTLHHPVLYPHIHAVHHRVTTPWAISGHYMHPVEFVLTGSLVLVGPLLLGSHVAVLWAVVVFRQWIAAEGHCGYRIPANPSHLFPGYGGNRFHDFHHSRFHGNYSGFLGWIDVALGTCSPGYLEAERGDRCVES